MIILSNIQKLYDGTSSTPEAIHERVDLWIEDGKVESLRPHARNRPKGSAVQIIDCSGLTVTPGLIDCHGHVTVFGIGRDPLERMNSLEGLLYAERILYTTFGQWRGDHTS